MMVSNSEPLAEGTVIMAEDQFAGRGQHGNIWHATAGLNLTFSVLLKPVFLPVHQQFILNMVVSNAICIALDRFIPKGIQLKWPNDIYYEDRKLGGVLIENNILGSTLKTSIIGIGINVNQLTFDDEQLKRATSMLEILQQDVDLVKLLAEICLELEKQYFILRSANHTLLKEMYLNRLYRSGKKFAYSDDQGLFEGMITGIEDHGALILTVGNEIRTYNFKEVAFII